MGKHLDVPADLDYLIEKRENDGDRRKIGNKKPASSEAAGRAERRKQTDRRKKPRKKSGP